MGCIHPAQVKVINEAFLPSEEEIKKALEIVEAFEKASKAGSGVVAVGSKMVDLPVVKRALRIINDASEAGRIIKVGEGENHE